MEEKLYTKSEYDSMEKELKRKLNLIKKIKKLQTPDYKEVPNVKSK